MRTPSPIASWRSAVDRAVMACGAFVLAVQLMICASAVAGAGPLVATGDTLRVLVVIGCDTGLLAICLVLCSWPTLLRSRAVPRASLALAAIALVAASGLGEPSPLPEAALEIVPVNTAQTAQIVVLAFVPVWRRALALVLLTGPLYVALRTLATDATGVHALDEWVLPTATSLAVLVVITYLRDGAAAADQIAAATRDTVAANASRANAELAHDEARRILHDEVISALRAVELGLPAADVRTASGAALASLAGDDRVEGREEFERRVRDAAPLDVSIDASAWSESPPPRVMTALAGAAAEALRNAVRHGDATSAQIHMSGDGERTEVRVADNGSGLTPGWAPGFGVRESIIGRLEDIGGLARVEPSPEQGVVVRLVWPGEIELAARTAGVLIPDRTQVLQLVGAICAFTTIYSFLRYPGEMSALNVLVAAANLALLVGVVVGLGRIATRHVLNRTLPLALFAAGVCALTWVGLVAAGDHALLSMQSWIVGCCANVVALVAFEVSARRVAPIVLAQVLTVAAFAIHDPTITVTAPLGALATPVVVGGLGALLGAALRRAERLLVEAQRRLLVLTEADAWTQAGADARRRHLAHLVADVVPFLRTAATTGTVEPSTATVLAAQCRDHLYLNEPLDDATRASVQQARQRGAQVTLRAGDHPAETWPTLRAVLDHVGPGHTVTAIPPQDGQHARIATTPAIIDTELRGAEHDAFRTVVAVSSTMPTRAQGRPLVRIEP